MSAFEEKTEEIGEKTAILCLTGGFGSVFGCIFAYIFGFGTDFGSIFSLVFGFGLIFGTLGLLALMERHSE